MEPYTDPRHWSGHTIRELERASIREFMERSREFLKGRVLDFGAGKPGTCQTPQPYRDLVEGEYVPFDKDDDLPIPYSEAFEAVICTQVVQYLPDPERMLTVMRKYLKPGGHLLLTYPTNWDEVEISDLWRFTKTGMERLLRKAGFQILRHERRASINLGGFRFPLGYGVVAQRPDLSRNITAEQMEKLIGEDELKAIMADPIAAQRQRELTAEARASTTVRSNEEAGGIGASGDGGRSPAPPRKYSYYTRLGIDESAAFLTGKLKRQEPFLFIRYGDGALECINGLGTGKTCDGEKYSPELALGMVRAWYGATAPQSPNVFVGDWLSASFGSNRSTEYRKEYDKLIADLRLNFLHFEALLLTRESPELLEFYRAVKADPRRKVYLGPKEHESAARMLGCEHAITPMTDLLSRVDSIYEKLANDPFGFDVLLWAAGMAGTIPVVKLWEKFPGRTYINLGSAMDPLTRSIRDPRGYTRSGQLTPVRAKEFFRELL
jgi:SAM-dependent methyltransferase